jgi:hypothetical protein
MITLDHVRQTMKEVVNEYGKDHGSRCDYIREGKPACIAAHVTYRLLGREAMKKLWGKFYCNEFLYELMEPLAIQYIDTAQTVQDNRSGVSGPKGHDWGSTAISAEDKKGMTWGKALEAAETWAKEVLGE